MIAPIRQAEREKHIAHILLESEAALDKLHHYYKFGRYGGAVPEECYFLLSHCAHLLFSLWLAESESSSGLFEYSPVLNALVSKVDLGTLRYDDYKRRMLNGHGSPEYLKNEPKWFNFWLKAVAKQDPGRPIDSEVFAQSVLTHVNQPDFLETTIRKKRPQKVLTELMKTDLVTQILRRSMVLLEEMIAGIVVLFSHLNSSQYTTEQLASIICLLQQVRRTVVSETPAQGPYVPASNKNWGVPSTPLRMYGGRSQGHLKIVAQRDGGSVVCTYHWMSGDQQKSRSWTKDTSTLKATYEEELFRTWAYDTGEPVPNPQPRADLQAHWHVQSVESKRLQKTFGYLESVRRALADNPQCSGLNVALQDASIDHPNNRHGNQLVWTYVKKLDSWLHRLKFAYREARVLGGTNPGAEVAANMWPPASSVRKPTAGSESAPLRKALATQKADIDDEPARRERSALTGPMPVRACSLPDNAVAMADNPPPPHGEDTAATNAAKETAPSLAGSSGTPEGTAPNETFVEAMDVVETGPDRDAPLTAEAVLDASRAAEQMADGDEIANDNSGPYAKSDQTDGQESRAVRSELEQHSPEESSDAPCVHDSRIGEETPRESGQEHCDVEPRETREDGPRPSRSDETSIDAHQPYFKKVARSDLPLARCEAPDDSGLTCPTIAMESPALGNTGLAAEEHQTNTTARQAAIADPEISPRETTSSPTDSVESTISQHHPGASVSECTSVTSVCHQNVPPDTCLSSSATSSRDQAKKRSSEADERQRLSDRRLRNMAYIMNILLGESIESRPPACWEELKVATNAKEVHESGKVVSEP